MGWGSKKRSRDLIVCDECEEEIDMENYAFASCASCLNVTMCTGCLGRSCEICKEPLCEDCSKTCDEDECDEFCFCPSCLPEHLEGCTSKSRAQRLLATADNDIKESKEEITKIQSMIEQYQTPLKEMRYNLANAEARKDAAEEDLREEEQGEGEEGGGKEGEGRDNLLARYCSRRSPIILE